MTISQLRRTVELIAQQWNPQEPPDPYQVTSNIGDAGLPLNTYCNLYDYLDQTIRKSEGPNPNTMVRKLLSWAWDHR